MKAIKLATNVVSILAFGLIFSLGATAQETTPKQRERIAQMETKTDKTGEAVKVSDLKKENPSIQEIKSVKVDDATKTDDSATVENKIDDKKLTPEEEAVLPVYNNYLTEYRLGPNDVITVEVFGQCPDYCKEGITVPPTAKVSYPLIREGVFVGGKTIEQVQDEITKKLDEYIIEPKVTVTLVKAMSARYSVLGKVAAPGVHVMDRKVSLYEAIVEAGGVLKDGDKKRVTLYRLDAQGRLAPQNVNLIEVERGKAEMIYLNPGDQVFVPDAGFKLNVSTIFKILEKASLARLLFGSPF
jgi:polysaccharide export outer membrane protein